MRTLSTMVGLYAGLSGTRTSPPRWETISTQARLRPSLWQQRSRPAFLIDEKEGRGFARQAGLNVRGVLGVLIRAKTMGEIASVKTKIDALRKLAGFFISASLEAIVLSSVSE